LKSPAGVIALAACGATGLARLGARVALGRSLPNELGHQSPVHPSSLPCHHPGFRPLLGLAVKEVQVRLANAEIVDLIGAE